MDTHKHKKTARILIINLAVLLVYHLAIFTFTPHHGEAALWNPILLAMCILVQVFYNIGLTMNDTENIKAYLLSIGLVLLIGGSTCFGFNPLL